MTHYALEPLLEKYLTGILTEPEFDALQQYRDDPRLEGLAGDLLAKSFYAYLSSTGTSALAMSERDQAMLARILAYEAPVVPLVVETRRRYKPVLAVAAAAAVVAGIWFWVSRLNHVLPVDESQRRLMVVEDAAPGQQGAILTLSDGRDLVLDSLSNGVIAKESGTQAVLQDGQLVYDPNKSEHDMDTKSIAYNTMRTPKGRQFQLILPDGTKVWLNAASSITYPTVFGRNERTVTVTGEAYFEVAANTRKPFYVDINASTRIEVLGTSFNINAYADEGRIRTTLLSGRVKVIRGDLERTREKVTDEATGGVNTEEVGGMKKYVTLILAPGQQAVIREGSKTIQQVRSINTSSVMAWKNGVFHFNGVSLVELMRQLARWYDIEVVYPNGVPDLTLGGEAGRDLNLSQVLEGLQEMGVTCRLEGRQLIVGRGK